jgi:DNA-binding CsgD family transcriptional regulator
MTRRSSERATEREVDVVAAVVMAGSEKAAAHRLGLSHSTVKHHLANARSKVGATTTAQLVWILAPRLLASGIEGTSGTADQSAAGSRMAPDQGPSRPAVAPLHYARSLRASAANPPDSGMMRTASDAGQGGSGGKDVRHRRDTRLP